MQRLACRSRGLRLGKALCFEPLELFGDGLFDDRGQITVGNRRAHERAESPQLVVKLGTGRELVLYLVGEGGATTGCFAGAIDRAGAGVGRKVTRSGPSSRVGAGSAFRRSGSFRVVVGTSGSLFRELGRYGIPGGDGIGKEGVEQEPVKGKVFRASTSPYPKCHSLVAARGLSDVGRE